MERSLVRKVSFGMYTVICSPSSYLMSTPKRATIHNMLRSPRQELHTREHAFRTRMFYWCVRSGFVIRCLDAWARHVVSTAPIGFLSLKFPAMSSLIDRNALQVACDPIH